MPESLGEPIHAHLFWETCHIFRTLNVEDQLAGGLTIGAGNMNPAVPVTFLGAAPPQSSSAESIGGMSRGERPFGLQSLAAEVVSILRRRS